MPSQPARRPGCAAYRGESERDICHRAQPGPAPVGVLAEDRAGFDAAYAAALEGARASLELSAVFATLAQWRWVAALQSDRADLHPRAPAGGRAGTRARAGLGPECGYRVAIDETSQAQLDALSPDGALAWHELHSVLALYPPTRRPATPPISDGIQVRVFGECGQGLLYYRILAEQQRVAILAVRWCD